MVLINAVERMVSENEKQWVPVSFLPLICFVTSDQSLPLSRPQLLHPNCGNLDQIALENISTLPFSSSCLHLKPVIV
jgi:hypothetical protein